MSERRPGGGARDYLVTLIGMGFVVVAGIGFTVVSLRDATVDESIEQWRLVVGGTLVIFAGAFVAYFLLARWAYGDLSTIRRERPAAVAVRSGASPEFRRVLDESSVLRRRLARARPPSVRPMTAFGPSQRSTSSSPAAMGRTGFRSWCAGHRAS